MMFSSCRTRTGSRLASVALLIFVVSLWIFSERAHAQTAPVLVDLGTLGGCFSDCYRGERDGVTLSASSDTATGEWHAFLWTLQRRHG